MSIPRIPLSIVTTLSGLYLILLGSRLLDSSLLFRHMTADGQVSRISRETHLNHGNRSSDTYLYYTFHDMQGEQYLRKTRTIIGYEKPGDRFKVWYSPDNHSRHLPLTGFGLALPGLLYSSGLALTWFGCRKFMPQLRLQLQLSSMDRNLEKAVKLTPLIAKTASRVARQTVLQGAVSRLGWLELPSPVDPHHRSLYYVFDSDEELDAAVAGGIDKSVSEQTLSRLRTYGYPIGLLDRVSVTFTTLEEISRENGEQVAAMVQMTKQ